ncbi:glyoxal reductase [Gordoniibacillus kamchatkensis]|uniref:Glyoxal reductase n=1 Tax=Gordoniibacillus kamchatkensis TaxID=1590651 RepID=A0ABR5AHH1_9BACL|nr:aldo/keto reductase [Paenibacillus sp. VKM B-2647]KIL40499.1 glyoxal reductase [Paenibacillus sp. VKM B-2647]
MIASIASCSVLRGGVRMPWLGLGVWQVNNGEEVENAVKAAIRAGYRSIDTAEAYENEAGVGKAIRESGVPRSELFITTKVANQRQNEGYDSVLRAFEESLKRLQLDVVDLYLVHWPLEGKYVDAWRALVKLYREGRVRAIGVSNFTVDHLERIIDQTGEVPAVNQVEYHPLLTRNKLHNYCKQHRIQLEAYSPLMQGHLDVPLLQELGRKYAKTPAQIVLRWNLQNEVVTIPKSVREQRIVENAAIFDFELSDDDMNRINGLNRDYRFLVLSSPNIISSAD